MNVEITPRRRLSSTSRRRLSNRWAVYLTEDFDWTPVFDWSDVEALGEVSIEILVDFCKKIKHSQISVSYAYPRLVVMG